MAEYDNSGILFKNDRKEKPTHADYQGNIMVAGKEYWLNAWIKQGAKGKFMSLSVKPKEAATKEEPTVRQQTPKPTGGGFDDMADDIPF